MEIITFLERKPALFDKYEKKLIKAANKLQKHINIETSVARLLYVVKRDCIDSYVNLYALEKFNFTLKSPIRVEIIDKEKINRYNIQETPTLIFLNNSDEEITRWSRTPMLIKEIESYGKETEINRVKRAYRNGKYLESTFSEITNILQSS